MAQVFAGLEAEFDELDLAVATQPNHGRKGVDSIPIDEAARGIIEQGEGEIPVLAKLRERRDGIRRNADETVFRAELRIFLIEPGGQELTGAALCGKHDQEGFLARDDGRQA